MIRRMKRAFTLIELLVVIGVMAVIAAGVVALIDPIEKTRQANDANVQNAVGQIATALQSYAAQQPTGTYPTPGAAGSELLPLVTAGELQALPNLPSGYQYYYTVNAGNTIATVGVVIQSKKYDSKCTAGTQNSYWIFSSSQGRACGTCLANGTTPPAGTACGASPPW